MLANQPIDHLKKVSLFSELPDQVLQHIADNLQEVTAAKDETIIRKGESGDTFYLIAHGSVNIHDGDHFFASSIAGEYFGEYALIDSYERSASVTANQETILYALTKEVFDRIMQQYPEVKESILKQLIERLRDLQTAQQQLAQSNQENLKQKQEIEAMNEDLQALSEEKTQLMRILAHDLRNLLTSSISIGTSVKDELEELSKELHPYMERQVQTLWRMNEMIDKLLDIKTVKVDQVNLVLTKFKLDELIKEVCEDFKGLASTKNIPIVTKLNAFIVELDRSFTRQIFENLIGNAVKFSPAGKKVVIKLGDKNGSLAAEVIDQGPGLSPKALEPLLRDTAGTEEEELVAPDDSGLSLAIVKKYVEAMQGTVDCQSTPGRGAHFTVSFPNFEKVHTEFSLRKLINR
ncbi:MAG: ATP-binding protein [Cyclobacteriaceae bacterium]